MDIEEVLAAHLEEWMALPDVVGGAIGESGGAPCITVFVAKLGPRIESRIPREVDGFAVILQETGSIRAMTGHGRRPGPHHRP